MKIKRRDDYSGFNISRDSAESKYSDLQSIYFDCKGALKYKIKWQRLFN